MINLYQCCDQVQDVRNGFTLRSMTDARIQKMLDWGKHQVGYREGWNGRDWDNIEKFVNDPGMADLKWAQGQPWCAIYASDMALHGGLGAYYPHTASVNAAYQWFKQHGYVSEYPAIGAWVMYGPSLDNLEHVGVCDGFTSVNENDLEGNTNSTGSPEGYEVMQKVHQRRDPWVKVYGYPKIPGVVLESADPVYNHLHVQSQPHHPPVTATHPAAATAPPRGIDLSSYQGERLPNGKWVFNPPHLGFTPDFGFVKVTEMYINARGEIVRWVNPVALKQIQWLRSIKALVGVYFYGHPASARLSHGDQVEFFLTTARPMLLVGDALCYDWEQPGINGAQKDATLALLLKSEPKRRTILYCNIDFWLNIDRTSQCGDGLWLADPSHAVGHPGIHHPVLIQQRGTVAGVDADYAIGWKTRAALQSWWYGKSSVKPVNTVHSTGIPAKPVAPKVLPPKIDTSPPPPPKTPRAVATTPVTVDVPTSRLSSFWTTFKNWLARLG